MCLKVYRLILEYEMVAKEESNYFMQITPLDNPRWLIWTCTKIEELGTVREIIK